MSEDLMVLEDDPVGLMPLSMGTTFTAYRHLQNEIDKAMPDQIMEIQGRKFRKKGYWRAVRAAFKLKVWCVSEQRIDQAGDWGYTALYRAEGGNGMSADGDGACMSHEKAERQRTEHNVRSHAHTRAFNRAVSNLVGFGEVSAEEVERDETPTAKTYTRATVEDDVAEMAAAHDMTTATAPPAGGVLIVEVKSLTAKSGKSFWALKFSDKTEATTNDADLADAAASFMRDKTWVKPTLKPWSTDPKKFNVFGLLRVPS